MPDLIVQDYNLSSVIPECPSHKHILFWDCEKDDQYWRRPYQLTDNEFLKLSYNEQEEIVETENERCRNGVWFYNHGVPTYLTNDNYHFLAYHKIDGKISPDFIQFQMIDYYFQKYCEVDVDCFGRIDLKPRREGDTQRKLSTAINRVITNDSFYVGIQSKTGKDAGDVNFGGLVLAFNKLPCWRKPKTRLINPSRELAFEEPPRRSSSKVKSLSEIEYEDYYLNSKVNWRATSSDAYDGDKLHIYIQDEYFKWIEADAYKAWLTHKKCLVDGEDIIGKAYLLSTVGIEEEEEKVSEEALLNGVKLWNESNANEKNGLNQSGTGLYRWFIGAHNSRRSKKFNWPDKYGNIPENDVKAYLLKKRESETDPQRKMIIIRQEPLNVQEALSSMLVGIGAFGSIQARLTERLTFLENYVPTQMRPIKYRQGNLAWADGDRFTKVEFRDNEQGRFKIPYMPNIAGEEMFNRVKKTSTNSFLPYSDTPFMMGCDPYNFDKTVDGQGSKGAFHIKHKYLKRYCLHYLNRPASIDLFFEDALMAAWFFGSKINPERSGSPIFDWFKRQGCYGFIVNRPDITKTSAFTKSDTEKGTTMTPANMELGCNLTENYFSKPNEEQNENIEDNLEYFWDEETLRQLIPFDKKKSSRFDAVMAMFLTEIGCQSMKKFQMTPIKVNEDTRASVLDYLIPQFTYTRSGESIATLRAHSNGKHNHRQ